MPEDAAVPQTESGEPENTRVQELVERVVLVSPTMGWWKGQYQIATSKNELKVSVDGRDIDRTHLTTPQTKLLECCDELKEWRKLFQKIDSSRAALVERYSVPFPIHGVRVIPRSALREFMDKLLGPSDEGNNPLPHLDEHGVPKDDKDQSIAYRLKRHADRFAENFDHVKSLMREHTDRLVWNRVATRIPTKQSIRSKFYIDVTPVYLHGNELETGVEEIQEYSDRIYASVERQVESAIESMVAEPRKKLAESLQNFHELVSRSGKVTQKSFKPIRAAFDKLQLFNFMADSDLMQNIQHFMGRLDNLDPKDINETTAANNGLLDAIEVLEQEVLDAEARSKDIQTFGRGVRQMRLNP